MDDAIKHGNDEVLKQILEQPDVDYYMVGIAAIKYNRPNIFKLLKNYTNISNFYVPAIISGVTKIVKMIVKNTKHDPEIVDEISYTAGNWGRLIICDWILKNGGSIDSILEGAIETGRLNVIMWAVNNGAKKATLKNIYEEAKIRNYKFIVDFLEDHI